MKEYLQLQFKLSNRKLSEFGIPPFLAYPLFVVCFFLLSNYLFEKTIYAEYIYLLLALSFLSKLNLKKRNDFLKAVFSEKKYVQIRLSENYLIVLPFVLFAVYEKSLIIIPLLLILAFFAALFSFQTYHSLTIPTPFFKKPFEFVVGFRKTFILYPCAYMLAIISITVNNINLGIASIFIFFFLAFNYYSKLENEYYIWTFNLQPNEFLTEKIKTALLYVTLPIVPIFIALAYYFSNDLLILLTFLVLGYCYLITIILAKYSVYPREISIIQGVFIAIGIVFPPLLVVLIPYFYNQSIKHLNVVLS